MHGNLRAYSMLCARDFSGVSRCRSDRQAAFPANLAPKHGLLITTKIREAGSQMHCTAPFSDAFSFIHGDVCGAIIRCRCRFSLRRCGMTPGASSMPGSRPTTSRRRSPRRWRRPWTPPPRDSRCRRCGDQQSVGCSKGHRGGCRWGVPSCRSKVHGSISSGGRPRQRCCMAAARGSLWQLAGRVVCARRCGAVY